MRTRKFKLDALELDARNPRTHGDRNLEEIRASLVAFGQVEPVIVQKGTRRVIAGHGRIAALRSLGRETADVLEIDVDDRAARELGLRLNRSAELAGWDRELLAATLRELEADGVADVGFSDQELDGLLAGLEDLEPRSPESDIDPIEDDRADIDAEPDQVEARADLGEVWRLGRHRLLCADSLDTPKVADFRKLAAAIVTDPPYAIFGSSTGVESDVADDRMILPFCRSAIAAAGALLKVRGHAYLFCDWRSYPTWREAARGSGLDPANMLVWDKGDFGLGAMYRNNHELVAFFTRRPARPSNRARKAGARTIHRPNILRHPRTGSGGFESEQEPGQRWHNAAKPVRLLQELIENSTDKGDRVVDPFVGSGSTLLACEQSGRVCYGIDLEPRCLDVTMARWERLTGEAAEIER